MNSTWFFIHGGWGGSWQWDPLREKMEARGIKVLTPDLPGMGGSSGKQIDLNSFITHISSLIERESGPISIGAFSFGGMTATALAGKYRNRIDKLVYVDAFVPRSGQSFSHGAGEKITRQIRAYCDVMGEEEMIPPFFETDKRYRSHPLNTLFTPVHYNEEELDSLNPLYIECTAKDPEWTFTPLLENTATYIKERGWTIFPLDSDHMPMYSHRDEVLKILL
jgi:pimeloyl-ACP methyl ester carboxylesterase